MSVDDITKKYISLNEAAKYCPYSQDYLSLRARQGKLRAIKAGRNWVTTKKWLNEYMDRYRGGGDEPTLSDIPNKAEIIVKKEETAIVLSGVPNYSPEEKVPVAPNATVPPYPRTPALRFGFLFFLTLALLISGAVFNENGLEDTGEEVSAFAYTLGDSGEIIIAGTADALQQTIFDTARILSDTGSIAEYNAEVFKSFMQWVGREAKKGTAISDGKVAKFADYLIIKTSDISASAVDAVTATLGIWLATFAMTL